MRLDAYLAKSGAIQSRNKAQYLIEKGFVFVNGKKITKSSYELPEGAKIEIKDEIKYVGRGGLKLEEALNRFKVDVKGKRCIDIGASTGGFTDCLLQFGASEVFSVDSGHNQLDPKLISDSRVHNEEGFNARHLQSGDFGKFNIAVMDVSFISQSILYPNVCDVLEESGCLISLIKPQFEVGKDNIGKNGIVKSPELHRSCIESLCVKALMNGLKIVDICRSPIQGGDGNVEYLAKMLHKSNPLSDGKMLNIDKIVFGNAKVH